jgi:uncharacterized membrane protein
MKYKKYLYLLILILISVIPLVDLFKPGLPLTHDGQDHVARIANFYQNLAEGNIIPRWAGNLNWGYGHPILEFLYPLPSYLASFFHFLGYTLVDSVKLVFGITFILSGLAMYIFIKELLNDDVAGVFAGALYVIAPYRFVDLYVRGAIGEHVAFIFPPLIFYFVLKLSKRYSLGALMGGAFSLAGLVLAHNAISLMFMPLFGLHALFLILRSKRKMDFIIQLIAVLLVGFGLSGFFWLPAFLEGKYTLRDIVTSGGEYSSSFVVWKDFFYGNWSYGGTLTLSKQIGIIQWVSIFGGIVSTYILYRRKNMLWIITFGSFIIFWLFLFLMTAPSDFIWQNITILQKFQFPWRLLSVSLFIGALMSGILLSLMSNKFKKIILIILIAVLLLVNKDYWNAHGFLQKNENFYTGIYNSTTDTGESAPIWSVRFMEKRPISKVKIIEGEGVIREIKRSMTKREYLVKAVDEIRILENTLYFPGWTVLVDGKKENIQFQDQNYRGLITFKVGRGSHAVSILYEETKVRKFADIVSLVSLINIAIILVFNSKLKKI